MSNSTNPTGEETTWPDDKPNDSTPDESKEMKTLLHMGSFKVRFFWKQQSNDAVESK